MTHLRKIMLEELQRRHYSEATTQRHIRFIERFAQHFHCSPDRLGPQHIREHQAQLFTVHKLAPGSVTNHLCALRFFYVQALKRPWSIADTPYPKKRHRLPKILSQEIELREFFLVVNNAHGHKEVQWTWTGTTICDWALAARAGRKTSSRSSVGRSWFEFEIIRFAD